MILTFSSPSIKGVQTYVTHDINLDELIKEYNLHSATTDEEYIRLLNPVLLNKETYSQLMNTLKEATKDIPPPCLVSNTDTSESPITLRNLLKCIRPSESINLLNGDLDGDNILFIGKWSDNEDILEQWCDWEVIDIYYNIKNYSYSIVIIPPISK